MVTIKTLQEWIEFAEELENEVDYSDDSQYEIKLGRVEEQKKEYDKRINYIIKQLPVEGLRNTLTDLRKILFGEEG